MRVRMRRAGSALGCQQSLVFTARLAASGYMVRRKRTLSQQPPQVDDGKNPPANRQYAQQVLRRAGHFLGRLHPQNLAHMLHGKSKFFPSHLESDQLMHFASLGLRFFAVRL